MSRRVLFFDDFPLESENQLFLLKLRKAFRGTDVAIEDEKKIPSLEVLLTTRPFAAIILDIMAAFPADPELEALAGIEVLKRCRSGQYGPLNQNALVYMRTARGEFNVREIASKFGSTGYFRPGSDDDELIAELQRRLLEV